MCCEMRGVDASLPPLAGKNSDFNNGAQPPDFKQARPTKLAGVRMKVLPDKPSILGYPARQSPDITDSERSTGPALNTPAEARSGDRTV